MTKPATTCPCCGNIYDEAGSSSSRQHPIFICSRHRERDTERIVERFECWACLRYFTVVDHPLNEKPEYYPSGYAYQPRKA